MSLDSTETDTAGTFYVVQSGVTKATNFSSGSHIDLFRRPLLKGTGDALLLDLLLRMRE